MAAYIQGSLNVGPCLWYTSNLQTPPTEGRTSQPCEC